MKSAIIRTVKKHYLFFLLVPVVIFSQIYFLAPNLEYGLDGGDNGEIVEFRQLRNEYPNNLQFIVNSYKAWGVYSHQYYYLGLLNYLFGTNFKSYHIVTLILKIIATLSIYPLFYFLSGSILIAFLGVILYAVSPSSAGSLDTLQHGSDYLAIPTLIMFLWSYIYIIRNNISSLKWLFVILVFFLSSLAIATDRTFILIVLIPIFEASWILRHYSKHNLFTSVKRICILLLPILIVLILKPSDNSIGAINKLPGNIKGHLLIERADRLLIPFISFSSTFLPDKYWSIIGLVQTTNFFSYMVNLLTVSMLTVFILTLITAAIFSKKRKRFISVVLLITFLGGIFSYFCALGHDSILINQAVAGFYILGLATSFLLEYIDNKNSLYFGLFFGPFVSFIFVASMWLATSEVDSIFTGIAKYLVVASIFSCFFLASIAVLLQRQFYQKNQFFKLISLLSVLLLILLIRLNVVEIKNYYDRYFVIGFGYKDQLKMRQLLLPYYQNLSLDNPRLIYADIHTDSINTQYYENTIAAGSNAWPLVWWPNLGLRYEILPTIIIDFEALKSGITVRDGKKYIFYNELSSKLIFYKPENFFAVRFVNKQLIDITKEAKEELGLNE